MLFDSGFKQSGTAPGSDFILLAGRPVPLHISRSDRARRYLLRVCPDGSAKVTVPNRGSVKEARLFVARNTDWLVKQLERLAARPVKSQTWVLGTEIFYRGENLKLEACLGDPAMVRLGDQLIAVPTGGLDGDLRSRVVKHLWRLSALEFPKKVKELATAHGLSVARVTIRNQRSRWGSCSHRGTISLNWRLIQAPPFVRDYVILHELMHLRQMNHSRRFWDAVENTCPDYLTAERWLKAHAALLK